jgi:non-specific serine/threonine protein kinase
MQTMKNTVNPAMLKQLAALPPAPPARRERDEPSRLSRLNPVMEDVHMRTVKHEPVVEKPKGLEDWEKKLVEKADNKRKATVAQLCKLSVPYKSGTSADTVDFLEYYCLSMLYLDCSTS